MAVYMDKDIGALIAFLALTVIAYVLGKFLILLGTALFPLLGVG
jgi:hypothetical protein